MEEQNTPDEQHTILGSSIWYPRSLCPTISVSPAVTMSVPIPGPRGVPLVGNVYDIEREVPLNSMELMADHYGTYLLCKNGPQNGMLS